MKITFGKTKKTRFPHEDHIQVIPVLIDAKPAGEIIGLNRDGPNYKWCSPTGDYILARTLKEVKTKIQDYLNSQKDANEDA